MYKFKTPVVPWIPKDHGVNATPGDIVICTSDRLKNFTKGLRYKVEKIQEHPNRGGSDKLQLEGIKGYISSSNFNLISKDEVRDAKLSSILDNKPNIIPTTTPTTGRKIDIVDDKNYQLFELIMNRISRDRNRLKYDKSYTNFSTMIDKISEGDKIWGIKSSDFNELKVMTLEQVFDLFIETRKK